MKTNRGFSENEIEELAKTAETAKLQNKGLDGVFAEFAAKHGRAKGSVRNFYYKLVADIKLGKTENKYFSSMPEINKAKAFDKQEERLLIEAVNEGVKNNKSVRRTLNELSGGDGKLMLRFQNKYRNMLCKTPEVFISAKQKDGAPRDLNEKNYFEKVPDFTLNRLKNEINMLVKNIAAKAKTENEALRKENSRLKDENSALRSVLRSSTLLSEVNNSTFRIFPQATEKPTPTACQ